MARKPPPAFVDAIRDGDYRSQLLAVRDELAARLIDAESPEVAAIARQLADVLKTLESLPVGERSWLDDLAAKRKKREARIPVDSEGVVKRGR